jgi:hypothetical protein
MRKFYIGILLCCLWIQRRTIARVGSPWWYWSSRLGAWASRKAGKHEGT